MGFLTPKYPAGVRPLSRRERCEAERREAEERRNTITEADLRRWERQGWRIERRSRFVIVSRENGSSSEMRSFTVLGNGRYGRR